MTREREPRGVSGFCLAVAGLYFLFAGAVSETELLAAIIPVVLACFFGWRWARLTRREFSLQAPWGKILGKTLRALLWDTLRVGVALAATLRPASMKQRGTKQRGTTILQDFRTGAERDVGRRAITILANSLPPNKFVVALAPGTMQLHSLAPERPDLDTEWPL